MTTTDTVAQLEAERLRPVPREDPAWMLDLRRVIALLADLLLSEG